MLVKRFGWASAFLAGLLIAALHPLPAVAVDANTCGYTQGPGGWYKSADRSGPYSLDGNCNAILLGSATGNGSVGVSSGAGGMSVVNRLASAAASTNPTLVKNTTGRVYKITGYNAAASIRWLHFYNVTSAPTAGTTTVFFSLPLPPGAYSFDAADLGYSFSNGIAFSITTGAADSDATALTAGDILQQNVWVQ